MKKLFLLTFFTLALVSCEEEIPNYTVTVSSSPAEGGAVSPQGGEYQQGKTATFTATPNEFYGFTGWSGADTSTINPVSIIVDTNKSLTARFEKLDTDNDGIADDIDQCPDTPSNEQADSNGCSVSQKEFELTVSVEGEGTVTEDVVVAPTIYQGTTQVQLTAVPVEGWEFTEWTGDLTGNQNPVTIEIDGTKNITAVFTKKDTDGDGVPDLEDTCAETPAGEEADENGCSVSQKEFELTVTTEGEGTVTEELIVAPSIYQGTSQVKLTADPAEGWEFTEWTGNATGSENPTSVIIDGAKSVTAIFIQKDTDGDGVYDLVDQCSDTPSDEVADENGCSPSQKDTDQDGVTDDIDQCPDSPEEDEVNENGCSRIYLDENGVTVKATTIAQIGEKYKLKKGSNIIEFLVVDKEALRNMIINGENVDTVVTTFITDFSYLFQGESNTSSLISWDTSNGENFEGMFWGSPMSPNLRYWNTSNAVSFKRMFYEANYFNSDISGWDTSNVVDMSSLFNVARRFNRNISSWNTSNVTSMNEMFRASAFNYSINEWDVSKVTDMAQMFEFCTFNQNLSDWDVSSVTTMFGMFRGAENFNQDISNWDVSSVTSMARMFEGAFKFNQNLTNWDVINVTTCFIFSDSGNWTQKPTFTNCNPN